MARPTTSRFPGFYKLGLEERRRALASACGLTAEHMAALEPHRGLSVAVADKMVENAVGIFGLPLGVGLNFLVDGLEYVVPMAVEEPSVIAAVSHIAAMVRDGGGFHCEADPPLMVAQVQLVQVADTAGAIARVRDTTPRLIELGDRLASDMVRFGGGLREIETRILPDIGDGGGDILVVHLVVDCRDAMGANTLNTIAEGLAPELEQATGGRAVLRILSNLADRRLARACCAIPVSLLDKGDLSGQEVAENIVWAYRFANRDPYRAATHNKGVMNGIDAVAIATGNDWRSIEAGAHAYAARSGRYTSLTRYWLQDGQLHGRIELPMAVGTVGGSTRTHATVRLCRQILGVDDAATLAKIMASVGLAQNLGALRALAAEGIQQGHMTLHARQLALAAGARLEDVDRIAKELVARRDVRLELAQELVAKKG